MIDFGENSFQWVGCAGLALAASLAQNYLLGVIEIL